MSYLKRHLEELEEERRVLVSSIIPHWEEKVDNDEIGVLDSAQIENVLSEYQADLVRLDDNIKEIRMTLFRAEGLGVKVERHAFFTDEGFYYVDEHGRYIKFK